MPDGVVVGAAVGAAAGVALVWGSAWPWVPRSARRSVRWFGAVVGAVVAVTKLRCATQTMIQMTVASLEANGERRSTRIILFDIMMWFGSVSYDGGRSSWSVC